MAGIFPASRPSLRPAEGRESPSQAAAEAPALRDLSIQAGGQGAETLGCHAPLDRSCPVRGRGLGPSEERPPLTEA